MLEVFFLTITFFVMKINRNFMMEKLRENSPERHIFKQVFAIHDC